MPPTSLRYQRKMKSPGTPPLQLSFIFRLFFRQIGRWRKIVTVESCGRNKSVLGCVVSNAEQLFNRTKLQEKSTLQAQKNLDCVHSKRGISWSQGVVQAQTLISTLMKLLCFTEPAAQYACLLKSSIKDDQRSWYFTCTCTKQTLQERHKFLKVQQYVFSDSRPHNVLSLIVRTVQRKKYSKGCSIIG